MLPQYFLSLVLAALLSGCSKPEAPKPPPPEVTVMSIEAKDSPVTFEFVGIT
jgi:membrane fusion protein (multidrug efflux system)